MAVLCEGATLHSVIADLDLRTDQLGQHPYRFGEGLARSVHQPDITVERVLTEVEHPDAGRPGKAGRRLRHQRHADTVFDQFDNCLQFIQLATCKSNFQ